METHLMTNRDQEFYSTIGPFLSRREVVKEIGGPVWDDDGKLWIVAKVEGRVAGFCGIHKADLCSVYVVPGSRAKGVSKALISRAIEAAKESGLDAIQVVTHAPATYLKLSFAEKSKRGSWSVMEKTL